MSLTMPAGTPAEPAGAYITTAIRISRAVHQLLRQMAVDRAARQGGRVSVSGVLAELALERQESENAFLGRGLLAGTNGCERKSGPPSPLLAQYQVSAITPQARLRSGGSMRRAR